MSYVRMMFVKFELYGFYSWTEGLESIAPDHLAARIEAKDFFVGGIGGRIKLVPVDADWNAAWIIRFNPEWESDWALLGRCAWSL